MTDKVKNERMKKILDLIAAKEFNPKGQLDKINILPSTTLIPIGIDTQRRNATKMDINNIILVCNQFYYLYSLIELARLNLVYSSYVMAETVAKSLYAPKEETLENLIESISTDFLLSAIIFFNSSFDYVKVLIKYTYSRYDELIAEYPRKTIENEMKKLHLKDDWYLALASCINLKDISTYVKWLKKSNTPKEVKERFIALRELNTILRKEYQANSVKHCALPYFERSDPADAMGLLVIETIEQFYSKGKQKPSKFLLGRFDSRFRIDEVQRFLIDYHNCTAALINEIVNDIRLYENETEEKGKTEE